MTDDFNINAAIVGCGGNCKADSDCDDKNDCTGDACVQGKCTTVNNADPCTSNVACSAGDGCVVGEIRLAGRIGAPQQRRRDLRR